VELDMESTERTEEQMCDRTKKKTNPSRRAWRSFNKKYLP